MDGQITDLRGPAFITSSDEALSGGTGAPVVISSFGVCNGLCIYVPATLRVSLYSSSYVHLGTELIRGALLSHDGIVRSILRFRTTCIMYLLPRILHHPS